MVIWYGVPVSWGCLGGVWGGFLCVAGFICAAGGVCGFLCAFEGGLLVGFVDLAIVAFVLGGLLLEFGYVRF